MKLLWSGSLSVGGTAVVPELPYYNVFLLTFSNTPHKLLGFRGKTGVDIISAFACSNSSTYIYVIVSDISVTNDTDLKFLHTPWTVGLDGSSVKAWNGIGNMTEVYGLL